MKVLVTYAIPQERVDVKLKGCSVCYCETGIGKVNAALAVYEAIATEQPDWVLNIGTAGSVSIPVDTIIICSQFEDRDMIKCKDFGVDYHHNFGAELAKIGPISHWEMGHTCNTGDSFVTQSVGNAEAYDMENFAVAALCKRKNLPFVSVKYITDKIGENSVKHWEDKLEDAKAGLQAFLGE